MYTAVQWFQKIMLIMLYRLSYYMKVSTQAHGDALGERLHTSSAKWTQTSLIHPI